MEYRKKYGIWEKIYGILGKNMEYGKNMECGKKIWKKSNTGRT